MRRTEIRPYGDGCRFLRGEHHIQFTGTRPTPVKDEIRRIVCAKGKPLTWDEEEKCLQASGVCWQDPKLQIGPPRAVETPSPVAAPAAAPAAAHEEPANLPATLEDRTPTHSPPPKDG